MALALPHTTDSGLWKSRAACLVKTCQNLCAFAVKLDDEWQFTAHFGRKLECTDDQWIRRTSIADLTI